jgi:hypothetical protein
VGDAGSEIDVQFLLDAVDAAGGSAERTTLCSAVGPKLGLVRVQQRWRGPAAQHPGQLSGQVVGALDVGVHAGSPAGGDPVGGVAQQEGARNAEPVGELGGEGERADALDPGAAGRRPRWPAAGAR